MLAIEKLALDLGNALKKQGLKIATVESCTGGGLSYWITSIAGSSAWFEFGLVTYSNYAKTHLLKIPPALIKDKGAVSEEVARAMAEGGLQHGKVDFCIGITGISGPEGGTVEKPVGTIWISIAQKNAATIAFVDHYHGDRAHLRMRAMERALEKTLTLL